MNMDLSDKKYAEQSRNKTALIGMHTVNTVLVLAYLIEVLKQDRTWLSYMGVVLTAVVPSVVAQIMYGAKKEAAAIRYILGYGYLLLYIYVLFTAATDLTFCYIIVGFVMLMVYADIKFLYGLAGVALLANVSRLVYIAMTKGLSAQDITNAEIIFACLILTSVFAIMSAKRISLINEANVDKAENEKEQVDALLNSTLEVAASITESISSVAVETESLKDGIEQTSVAMSDLSDGANEVSATMQEQMASTQVIHEHIDEVVASVGNILEDGNEAQASLKEGNTVMAELLELVKKSEESGVLVTQKVTGLKEYADRMQEIMGLISNVADQTGLLALNASIEAARAGEAGRGFGVVATEISTLSAQTNAATNDITDLIHDIVVSIDEVADAMSQLLENSQTQNRCVGVTADNFEKIHEKTQGIIDQAAQLKKAVDIVADENQQIEEKIGQVSSITQEVTARSAETLENCNMNLRSVEEVAAIMDSLRDEARKLER
ncbi:MAG: hypothetical protein IJW18_03495 [Lachnospiraceae bacterium]|nr:hypothetical protein [Lachnospiraceae bacterium]